MIKRFLIIFIIFQTIILFSCEGNDIYKNDEVGFSIKIPDGFYLDGKGKKYYYFKEKGTDYYIRIYVDKPEDLLDGVEQFNKIKNDIENNRYPDIPNIPAMFLRFKIINSIKVGLDFHTGYDVYDGVFGLRIFFIKNNRLVTIYLQYEFTGPKDDLSDKDNLKLRYQAIEKKYYEKAEKEGVPANKQDVYVINKIAKDIKGNKTEMPKEIVTLFHKFDKLVGSLRFYNIESIYKPSVNNLRFRESPTLDGKYIRTLKKGEKLQLLETGKTETINGVKGTWVKVKTEKGEIGWCFDAYLEEVK